MDRRHRATLAICALVALAALRVESSDTFVEVTEEQTKAAEKAMRWLLKAQNRDGSWGHEANSPGDITCTCLAGLALLENGVTEREGADPAAIKALRGAVDYVMKAAKSARDDIEKGQSTMVQGKLGRRVHNFFGVIFLTQVYGMRTADIGQTNEEMREVIARLTDIISKSQESDGSWHKETWGSLKATGMAWLALRAAASTGVPIRHATVDKTVKFIKSQYNPNTKLYDSNNRMGGYQAIYATATCVRVMVGMGEGQKQTNVDAVDKFIQNMRTGEWKSMFLTIEGEDYLSAMVMTHSLIGTDDERWRSWYDYVRTALIKRQNSDGTWVTTACITGRTFPTACALLTLDAPKRLTPIQQ